MRYWNSKFATRVLRTAIAAVLASGDSANCLAQTACAAQLETLSLTGSKNYGAASPMLSISGDTTVVGMEVSDLAAIDSLNKSQLREARRAQRLHRLRQDLIPSHAVVQYAGSIGAGALGWGWTYGRRGRIESETLVGFVPRSHPRSTDRVHITLTLKQRYVPWRLTLRSERMRGWAVDPLTLGFFANMIYGKAYWRHEPSRYGGHYYNFSTAVRWNLFVGSRVEWRPLRKPLGLPIRRVGVYYELSTCDLYVVSSIPNRRVRYGDILSLAFGLQVGWK